MPLYLSSNGVEPLVIRYRERGVIIDTNLLLLLLFGLFDKTQLKRFKCVAQYEESDFEILKKLAFLFKQVYVTPQILAELTNLAKVSETEEKKLLATIIQLLRETREKYFAKNQLLNEPLLVRFGFTDTTILTAARGKRLLVITEDFPLTIALQAESCDVLNLNDIRTQQWLR